MMRYVRFLTPGGPENLRLIDAPIPIPQQGESLIKVVAAGMNRADLLQRAGLKKVPKGFNPILGLEISGILHDDHHPDFRKGDEIVALTNGGGYADYVCVPHSQILPRPRPIDMVSAAGICETWFTCWLNLVHKAALKKNDFLLVHGAAGGIGSTAIQLAQILSAKVIAAVKDPNHIPYCTMLGAHIAFEMEQTNLLDMVKKVTDGHGADVILDILGGPFTELNIKAAAHGGRIAQIAFLKGAKGVAHLPQMMDKDLTHFGSMLSPASQEVKAQIANDLYKTVWPHFTQGHLKVPVDRVFNLEQVARAHAYMEKGGHHGKIILNVSHR